MRVRCFEICNRTMRKTMLRIMTDTKPNQNTAVHLNFQVFWEGVRVPVCFVFI